MIRTLAILIVISFLLTGVAMADKPARTEAEGMSCMGYDKSRKQTETDALVNAKRNAAEKSMTSIKSETVIKNMELEKDIVAAYAEANVKVLHTLESKWYRDDSAGDCYKVRILAEVSKGEARPGGKDGFRKDIEGKGIAYSGDSFIEAVRDGKKDIVELFIKAGIDLGATHSKDGFKVPAVHIAASKGNIEMLRILVEAGADVNATSASGANVLIEASMKGNMEMVRLLVKAGSDVNKFGGRALIWAARKKHAQVIGYLLDKGASAKGEHAGKAFIAASERGDAEVVRIFLDKGADIEARDGSEYTALIRAAEKGRTDVVRFLIKKGADMSAEDKFGFTALIRASQYGKTDAVGLLIDEGADVNAANKKGESALIWAVRNNRVDVANKLLEAGADRKAKDGRGKSAQDWAKSKGKKEMIKILGGGTSKF